MDVTMPRLPVAASAVGPKEGLLRRKRTMLVLSRRGRAVRAAGVEGAVGVAGVGWPCAEHREVGGVCGDGEVGGESE